MAAKRPCTLVLSFLNDVQKMRNDTKNVHTDTTSKTLSAPTASEAKMDVNAHKRSITSTVKAIPSSNPCIDVNLTEVSHDEHTRPACSSIPEPRLFTDPSYGTQQTAYKRAVTVSGVGITIYLPF